MDAGRTNTIIQSIIIKYQIIETSYVTIRLYLSFPHNFRTKGGGFAENVGIRTNFRTNCDFMRKMCGFWIFEKFFLKK